METKFLPRVFIALSLIMCFANVRAVASEHSITVQDIVQLREFSGLSVCPSGKLLAIRIDQPSISTNQINHKLVIIEWPSREIRLEVDAGRSINTYGFFENIQFQWSPTCSWVYYRARNDNEVQVWRLNTVSGIPEMVTSDEADILDFKLAENGRVLTYKTSASRAEILAAEEKEYKNGVLIDENIFPWHRLVKTLPMLGGWRTVRRWSIALPGHLLAREVPIYKTFQIKDKKIRTSSKLEIAQLATGRIDSANWIPESSADFKISPDGDNAVISLSTTYSPGGRPLSYLLASVQYKKPSEVHECTDSRCTAEYLTIAGWSKDGSTVYFIAEQTRGAAGIYAWMPENGYVRTILETEGTLGALASAERINSKSCPIYLEIMFCTAADHGAPPRLLAISLNTNEVMTIYDPNSELRSRFNLTTKRINWKDRFNRDSLGILVYPRNYKVGTRYPLIITTYRCSGFLTGGLADGGPEYVLAEDGFLVLCIDFNWKIPPDELTREYSRGPGRYVASLSEYETAIDILVLQGIADRYRVGITGISFSSQAVSYALTHSSAFQAAALRSLGVWEPSHDLFFHPGMELTEANYKSHNISENSRDAEMVYKDIAMSLRADHVEAPILIQASDGEYLGSLSAFVALRKLGKPIEMHVFPDETHQFHQPVHRYVNFTRTFDWFRFWLQNCEDPASEKAMQYKRWRELRLIRKSNSNEKGLTNCGAN